MPNCDTIQISAVARALCNHWLEALGPDPDPWNGRVRLYRVRATIKPHVARGAVRDAMRLLSAIGAGAWIGWQRTLTAAQHVYAIVIGTKRELRLWAYQARSVVRPLDDDDIVPLQSGLAYQIEPTPERLSAVVPELQRVLSSRAALAHRAVDLFDVEVNGANVVMAWLDVLEVAPVRQRPTPLPQIRECRRCGCSLRGRQYRTCSAACRKALSRERSKAHAVLAADVVDYVKQRRLS